MDRCADQAAAQPDSVAVPEGLTSPEAAARLRRYGPNAIVEAPPRTIGVLLRRFWGVIPWMLELALVIDLVLGRWIEALFIGVLLVLNAYLGFRQESRATKALALLRQRLTVSARVRRDGRWQVLPAAQIVPGDFLRLRAGDIVPADIRLADGEVLVDQSVLTGESLPVEGRPGSTAYSGSVVSRGEASGEVSATASRTYFGKTADLVRLAAAPPRLERLVVGVAKYLGALDVFLVLAVFAVTIVEGRHFLGALPFMLMLLVASVPMALPVMFTMSAAMGARMLAEKGILATRLSAIEDAAAMNVLCLDKTGTLTENRLAVGAVVPIDAASPDEVLRLAALASDEATQDPLDLAILKAARERALGVDSAQRLSFVPFDPSIKRSEVTIRENGEVLRVVKGEPATIAAVARTPWESITQEVARLSADGSRVLAVAAGTEKKLRVAGLLALSDPPRADSAALIAELGKRGVRVQLVTGDGEATARAIAAKVGITGDVAPAGTIGENLDSQTALRFAVFARVLPQDKFFLVQALQKAGHVVGMTGDGVNDAPALRQADIGIAVANATDVAKAAAGLVLTLPGLGEIITAIEASRRIYRRMQTFTLTMMTRKITIPLFLALGVLALNAFVLSPLLIVLLMITTDVATMAVSTDQVTASPEPDRWAIRPLMVTAVALAIPLLLLSGAVFWAGTNVFALDTAKTQTLVFLWLVFAGSQGLLYVTRARSFFWTKPRPGRWLNTATLTLVCVSIVLAFEGWLMAPLPPSLIGGVLVLAAVYLVGADLVKVALARLVTKPQGAFASPAQ
ncbi:MAG TPA: plasma-membrane proton-efflux P-type ATPase [Burkholderiales bacterium]|nr:plasma-membrane proton-efflux P-type ATPase [Burkholderiales bacterium]